MAKEPTDELQTLEAELKRLEIEERKQALESRKLQDELARLQLTGLKAELETKQNNKKRGAEDARKALEDRAAIQARCNHHCGGEGAMAILQGQGDEERPTTIGAQVFLDDRIRLRCNRCGTEWWSDDKDRARWAQGVNLWKHSFTKSMMVVGGLKIQKQPQITV
jgi:hypothetical protein